MTSEEIDWIDRERGILTKGDREFLLGGDNEELTQNALNQRRFNIRNRIKNAIFDFHILVSNLPLSDIDQIFEPAYEWSREFRHLNEEGRATTNPELTPLLSSWMALFEFYSYGMYASRMAETQELMRGLIQEGVERGYRRYQHENQPTYQEIAAVLDIQYGNQMLRNNYFRKIRQDLPNEPNEIIEKVILLHRENKVPYNLANQWIEELVKTPQLE